MYTLRNAVNAVVVVAAAINRGVFRGPLCLPPPVEVKKYTNI